MKLAKKLFALTLAVIMVMALGVGAFAAGEATITINNSAKGETYLVYMLFEASVTGEENGSISYKGVVPAGLEAFFTADDDGYITMTEAAGTSEAMSDELKAALKTWTGSAIAVAGTEGNGNGGALTFEGLDYGYYVVTTSQGDQAITVTSTNPNASIYDKNSTTPTIDKENGKVADKDSVSVGDTVTYTVTFTTSNYDGEGEGAKQIVEYTIADTLPDFLGDVTVTGITIGGEAYTVDGTVPQFDDNKEIAIPWAADGVSSYANGAEIVITYSATVTANAVIGKDEGNVNEVTITYRTTDGSEKTITSSETIYTYALAIQKVDENDEPLAGATFTIAGVTATENAKGDYTVTSTSAEEPTVMECDANGYLVVKGIAAGDYELTEVTAPDGYNKLTETKTVTAQKIGSLTSTTKVTIIYDAEGNVVEEETSETRTVEEDVNELVANQLKVVNNKGAQLPSTGGIGTTIFYVVGGVLVVAAVVLLITKKRMSAKG